LETSQELPKLRLLRAFNLFGAVAAYCARNAGRLLALTWFPFLLLLVCQVTLDWLAIGDRRLPEWLLSPHYNPPTWLTPVVNALWVAMAWVFVLSHMADRTSSRGLVAARILRPARPRFELSRSVLLAAGILAAAYLFGGFLRDVELKIVLAAYGAFGLSSDASPYIWAGLIAAFDVLIMAAVYAFSDLVAGRVLLAGSLDIAQTWTLTRGHRLRLVAIFLLLTVASGAIDALAAAAVAWLAESWADPVSGTVSASVIRRLADLPLFMLWTIVDAVTVGLILDALEPRTASIFD
jgi:hypothetical protein